MLAKSLTLLKKTEFVTLFHLTMAVASSKVGIGVKKWGFVEFNGLL